MFPHRRILTFSTQHTNACVHPRSLALLQYMRTIQYAIHAIHPRLLALLQYIRTHPRQNCCYKIWSFPMQLKQGVKSLDVVTDSHGSFACAGKIQTHCCGNVKSIIRRQSVRCLFTVHQVLHLILLFKYRDPPIYWYRMLHQHFIFISAVMKS